MSTVQWRSTDILDRVSSTTADVSILVLTGNGAWLARQALAAGRERGEQIATNLPNESAAAARATIGAAERWPRLGQAVSATLQVASVIASLDPRAVLIAVGTGVAAPLTQPAIDWLRSRRVDPAFVDAATMADELPAFQLVVLDLKAAGPLYAAHIIELIDRHAAAREHSFGVIVLLDEAIDDPHAVTEAHDLATRRLAAWARQGDATWVRVPALDAETAEVALDCEPLVAALLVDSPEGTTTSQKDCGTHGDQPGW